MLGYVKRLNAKDGKSKKPPYRAYTIWSMVMENQDGSESGWLSLGFEQPSFKEGQWANYVTETTPKGVNLVSFEKAEAPPVPSTASASSNPAVPAERPYVSTQDSIVYQSSRKDALALIGLLLEHDGLPMSASAAKAGQAKRYEEIKNYIDKLTVEYFNDVQSLRVLSSVVDAGEKPEPAATASGAVSEDND